MSHGIISPDPEPCLLYSGPVPESQTVPKVWTSWFSAPNRSPSLPPPPVFYKFSALHLLCTSNFA